MNDKAVSEYLKKMNEAIEYLNNISEYLEDHGEVSPDEVNWGHVGSMAHLKNVLKELSEMVTRQGEYA